MVAFTEERTESDETTYYEFTIVGVDVEGYSYAVGSKLLVEGREDGQGQLQLGRIKVLVESAHEGS